MVDHLSHLGVRSTASTGGGTRATVLAALRSVACVAAGFIALGVVLFPLSGEIETMFRGSGSALSTQLILLGVVVCNLAVWAPARIWISVCCLVLGAVSLLGLPAAAIALVRCGERRSLRVDAGSALTVIACTMGSTAFMCLVVGASNTLSAVAWAAGCAVVLSTSCLLWGRVRGTRAALMVSLREQALAAERLATAERHGRDADVARALAEERSSFAEERSALARDMHDGISHRLSVVALHAGAMSSRSDLSPEQLRAAALTVRDAAEGTGVMLREALTALRGISEGTESSEVNSPGANTPSPATASAGSTRSPRSVTVDGAPSAIGTAGPSTSATSLTARAAAAQAQGLGVDLRWWGVTQADLDRDPERATALARITDEILMNALKYAPDQPLAIDLSIQHGQLRLLARNPLPARRPDHALGTGFGLVGLAERATLVGGGAKYGKTIDAHFQVDVWIPWS